MIITDYGSFNGFLAELCIDLLKKDMELHVICSKDKVIDIPDKYSYEGLKITFHILEIPRKPSILAQFKTAKQIRRIVDIVKPELVHAHLQQVYFLQSYSKNLILPTGEHFTASALIQPLV